jgi:hypothetical protein
MMPARWSGRRSGISFWMSLSDMPLAEALARAKILKKIVYSIRIFVKQCQATRLQTCETEFYKYTKIKRYFVKARKRKLLTSVHWIPNLTLQHFPSVQSLPVCL